MILQAACVAGKPLLLQPRPTPTPTPAPVPTTTAAAAALLLLLLLLLTTATTTVATATPTIAAANFIRCSYRCDFVLWNCERFACQGNWAAILVQDCHVWFRTGGFRAEHTSAGRNPTAETLTAAALASVTTVWELLRGA